MNTKHSKSLVYNMGWLGDSSHRRQGCQAWTAVGLPPKTTQSSVKIVIKYRNQSQSIPGSVSSCPCSDDRRPDEGLLDSSCGFDDGDCERGLSLVFESVLLRSKDFPLDHVSNPRSISLSVESKSFFSVILSTPWSLSGLALVLWSGLSSDTVGCGRLDVSTSRDSQRCSVLGRRSSGISPGSRSSRSPRGLRSRGSRGGGSRGSRAAEPPRSSSGISRGFTAVGLASGLWSDSATAGLLVRWWLNMSLLSVADGLWTEWVWLALINAAAFSAHSDVRSNVAFCVNTMSSGFSKPGGTIATDHKKNHQQQQAGYKKENIPRVFQSIKIV